MPQQGEWINCGTLIQCSITQNKKEQTLDIHSTLDESQVTMLSEKNGLKGYILYDFIYTFWKKQIIKSENRSEIIRS